MTHPRREAQVKHLFPAASPEVSKEATGLGRHNLPPARTSFVGREHEVVEIKRVLPTTRLLTLTGAGGSGKTRLALEVAKDLLETYPDGVWLVELAGLSEGELGVQAVAAVLRVREQQRSLLWDTLVDYLRPKDVLLILDNCEHLIEATARLIDGLLVGCPKLRVLATSRELLGVPGEVVWRVPSLPVPDPRSPATAQRLSGYASVRLFVDRARQRDTAFGLGSRNARAVADICRRVDGIPLAIELACARIGVLSPEQIAQRLKNSLKLLSAGDRTATPRHQTLKGTLDWSYELLGEPEGKLFERLSVFMGGWALEAAETVGTGDGVKEEDVLDLLSRLVDKSLVVAEAGEGEARYRMLEPIRQYGLERLEQSGNADAARRHHAAFFLALAEEAEPELRGPQQGECLKRLEMEHDNLRAALSWALRQEEAELGLRLGGALGEFWHLRGHLNEGRRWLQAGLAKGGATLTAARARALARAGYIAWEQGDYAHSVALSEESLTLSRKLGDARGAAAALYTLGWAAMFGNQVKRASALVEEAVTLQRAAGDTAGVARSLLILGFVANYRRDYEQATALYEESLMLAREAGDGFAIALSLGVGALAALGRGDHQQTKLLCEEGLRTSRRLKMMHLTAAYLHVAASLAGSQGKATRSARLWGAAEALREAIGTVLSPFERHLYEPYLTAAQAQLEEAAWKAAWAGGRAMTTDEAIEYALSFERAVPPTVTVPETGETLTSREVEVLILISAGASNQQISEELFLSIHTVKRHVVHILRKLGVSSRTQAATRARELGVL